MQLDFRRKEKQFFGKVSLFTVKCFVWLILDYSCAFVLSMQWLSLKKNIDKLICDQFLQPVKDHPYDKFGYVGKIMPFFKMIKQNLVIKNPRMCVWAY